MHDGIFSQCFYVDRTTSTQIFAAEVKPSNMLNNCEPYFLSNTTVEDSFVMAGTTYTNGLKCRVAYDRTTQIHFNVGENYSSVSFEVGHIDGTASGSSDIVMTVLAEEDQVLEEVSLTNTDIPKNITIPLTGVKQLSIKWNCRYYDSYFGIGAINFVGSQPSVREKESNMVNNNEPYTMNNTTIEDSFNMGNTTYTGGLKCRVAFDRTTQAHFNFGGNYESMSFEVGHIDGLDSGSSDIVMTIMKDGNQIIEEIALSNTALPRLVEVPLTGVHQLSVQWSCSYYDSYFGIGAIHLKSNGVVRDITLDKQSLQLTKGNLSAYLQAFIVPADADNLEIIWKSSNPEIASVDSNGLVCGISRGTAEITATTVSGNYTASCIVDVDLPGNLENASVTLSQNSYTYTGSAIEPNVKVTYAGKTLNEGTDYAVSYLDNISAGTVQVILTGTVNYTGTVTKAFTIACADIARCTVSFNADSYVYNGTAQTPAITVKDGNNILKSGTDYTVTYANNANAGTAQVTVTGRGNYTGKAAKTFTIQKAAQTFNYTKSYSKAYGSKSFTLDTKLKAGNGSLTYATSNEKVAAVKDGKVTVTGTGIATITVKAAGNANYNETSVTVTIKVSPAKQTLKSLKNVKGKKLTVKWKKDTRATGYQIQYSTDKNFKKGVKTATVSKYKTVSKTITKLTAGKRYYVRVRSYKSVKVSGKTQKLYGAWSGAKRSGSIKK